MNRTKTVLLAVVVLPALAACNGSTPDDSPQVERIPVAENACDLVPSAVVADWGLAEVSHTTTTETALSFGRCVMAGGSADDVTLDLSLTNYSGGDASSASAFASDERAETCAELSASEGSRGTVTETDSSCRATSTVDGAASTVVISEVDETHGVVRIEMRAPDADADRGETAVDDVLAAVEADAS